MRPRPWFLRERYWAIAAAIAVACACWCTHCRGAEPILAIHQSGNRTVGAVIHTQPGRTLILTCKHGRRPGDAWQAGPLSGDVTILDQHHDLALLVCGKRWPGPVLELSDADPALPIVFVTDATLPRPLPFGCPLHEAAHATSKGHSGAPLIVGGKLAGVLWGNNETRAKRATHSWYIPREAVRRFLGEVKP